MSYPNADVMAVPSLGHYHLFAPDTPVDTADACYFCGAGKSAHYV